MSKFIVSGILISLLMTVLYTAGCRDPEAERKIDGNLKSELLHYKQKKELDKRIVILFKINEDLTELHHEMLADRGVEISANIGPIFTATIPAKQVYNLAKMRFITFIQSQSKLKIHTPDSTRIDVD
ncbi:hypothetical protein JXB12_12285 [candidate division KSB1 bacterium]|nr:hypothetical protein [candidate division KSB1 bacterium]